MAASKQEEGSGTATRRTCNFTIREFIFIIIVVLTEIGCNISLDTPGALQNAIIKNYHLTAAQFALLYSLYFIPTILLNGFSGFLIDRVMGIKMSTLVYSVVGLIGVAVFAAGGVSSVFWLMLMGRLIFGLGNELATGVCVNYCIFAWYRNTIMNVVSSLSNDGSVAGTLVIYQVGPRLFDLLKQSLPEKTALDIVICLASGMFLITGGLAVLMTMFKPKEDAVATNTSSSSETALDSIDTTERVATLKDILQFPLVFWVLCILNLLYASLNSFSQFSQGLLTSPVFNLTVNEASDAITAMGAVKIALSLPLSLSVDIVGRNTWYVIIAQSVGTLAYFLFVLRINAYVGMVLAGLSSSIFYASVMPMYAYPLEKHLIGSCYGIMSTAGGLSMFGAPLLVGRLVDAFGYMAAVYFYFIASALCLVCILVIWILDRRSTGILSMTPKQRIEFERLLETARSPETSLTVDFSSTTRLASNMSS